MPPQDVEKAWKGTIDATMRHLMANGLPREQARAEAHKLSAVEKERITRDAVCSILENSGMSSSQAKAVAEDASESELRRIYERAKKSNNSLFSMAVKSWNGEKRLVTAITNVVSDAEGNPVVDHQGDVITIDNLEDAFIAAFADGGIAKGGVMHTGEHRGDVDIVGYLTLSHDERIKCGFGQGPEIGIVKLRVNDAQLWADVKAGKYPEVSIEGEGTREPLPPIQISTEPEYTRGSF